MSYILLGILIGWMIPRPKFIGDIEQRPPIYSAIKINGIRSYKIARQNKWTTNYISWTKHYKWINFNSCYYC